MDTNHVSGAAFKKMIVKANSPHAKYVPSAVKKAINDMHLFKHVHEGAKVNKQTAKQIMHKLKERGLTGHMKTTVDKYVSDSFRHEKRRVEMIRKQNLDTRRQEIAAEKAAELQKTTGKGGKTALDKNKPMASALQGGAARSSWAVATTGGIKKSTSPSSSEQSTQASQRLVSALSQNSLKRPNSGTTGTGGPAQQLKSTGAQNLGKSNDEIIDLAID